MRVKASAIVGLSILVGACSGGGDGASSPVVIAPTPTPVPSPTPSPTSTPTPTPSSGGSLINLVASQIFVTTSAGLQSPLNRPGRVSGSTNRTGPTSGALFRYDSATRGYIYDVGNPLMGLAFEAGFLPRDVVASQSDARTTYYDAPRDPLAPPGTPPRNLLTLFNVGSANDLLALVYSSFGLADFTYTDGSLTGHDYRAFAYYGVTTPDTGVPRTGTSTFTGRVIGQANPSVTDLAPRYAVTGTIQVTINWATRTFSGSVTLVGNDGINSNVALGTQSIVQDGTPAALGRFTGTFPGNGSPAGFLGLLAGPAAEELSGSLMTSTSVTTSAGNVAGIDIVASFGSRR